MAPEQTKDRAIWKAIFSILSTILQMRDQASASINDTFSVAFVGDRQKAIKIECAYDASDLDRRLEICISVSGNVLWFADSRQENNKYGFDLRKVFTKRQQTIWQQFHEQYRLSDLAISLHLPSFSSIG